MLTSTSEPKESLKIALLLLKGTNTSDERVKLNLLVSKIYQTLGDYSNAANYLFDASTNIKTNSVFQSAKIKSLTADNWNFNGHSGEINADYLVANTILPTTNKTVYFRNWTFNANNKIQLTYFASVAQAEEIDFSDADTNLLLS